MEIDLFNLFSEQHITQLSTLWRIAYFARIYLTRATLSIYFRLLMQNRRLRLIFH
jgi:hypothetical protein